jgi:hypothetical protein
MNYHEHIVMMTDSGNSSRWRGTMGRLPRKCSPSSLAEPTFRRSHPDTLPRIKM